MASFESGPVGTGRSANPSRGRRMMWLASAALIAPALFAAPAFAQDQAGPADAVLQDEADIVVTAQKREESVRDVPQSLIVASGEELTS